MRESFLRGVKGKTFLSIILPIVTISLFFSSAPSLSAKEILPASNVQLVMVGNSLAAIDEVQLESTHVNIEDQAQELERQIMLRKLAGRDKSTADLPQMTIRSSAKANNSTLFVSSLSKSVLSNGSFFSDLDEEIIDPFRSMDNLDRFRMRLLDFLDFKIALFGEYDDNIFLTPAGKVSDWKTIINQSIEIKYPMDTFFLEALYAVNLDIYSKADEVVDTQNAGFRLSYYPFDRLSLAFADQFLKVGNSAVATPFGDQLLTLGYITNSLVTQLQYELWKNGHLEFTWNYDYIDFSNDNIKRFINRNVHTLDTRLQHQFTKLFSNSLGYRFKEVDFVQFNLKNSSSNILYYGAEFEVPGIATLSGAVEYEAKFFDNPNDVIKFLPPQIILPATRRRAQDHNVNFKFAVESNLSRFNTISLSYDQRLMDSSRAQFSQYLAKTFGVNSRYFIDNKTIFFSSLFYEHQGFEAKDAISIFFPGGNATAEIYATGVTLRRILSEWLYFDVGYTYMKRKSQFMGESSKNNRFRFGAHATF